MSVSFPSCAVLFWVVLIRSLYLDLLYTFRFVFVSFLYRHAGNSCVAHTRAMEVFRVKESLWRRIGIVHPIYWIGQKCVCMNSCSAIQGSSLPFSSPHNEGWQGRNKRKRLRSGHDREENDDQENLTRMVFAGQLISDI